jgi:multiple sugar transport system substrate-binding protein
MKPRISVAVLALLAALAGCGGDASSEGGDDPGRAKLVIWNDISTAEQKAAWATLDRMFEASHPGITVEQVPTPSREMPQKLRAAIATRRGPDLVSMYPGVYSASFKRGLLPLQDRLTAEQKGDIIALEASQAPDGNLYSLPVSLYGYVWSYNRSLFRKAGLDPEKPPATWDEMLAACGKLRSAGIEPVASGWRDGVLLEWFMYVFGDQLLNHDELLKWYGADLPVNNPQYVEALDRVLEMEKSGCFQEGGLGRSANDTATEFQTGKAAMVLFYVGGQGAGGYLQMFQKLLGKDKVGIFLNPPFPGAPYDHAIMDTGPTSSYGITRFSEHQDAAWEYLSFLVRPETQEVAYEHNADLPVNRQVDVSKGVAADDKTLNSLLEFLSIEENTTTYMGWAPQMLDVLHARTPAVISGTTSPQEMLDEVEQERQKILPQLK